MGKLTDSQIRAWVRAGRPLAGRSDGEGLTFTLSAAGAASWVLRYRIARRARELTLGSYPAISLQVARSLARAARSQIERGDDVAATRRRALLVKAKGGSFRDLAEDYMLRVAPALSGSTRREVRRYLDKDLLPTLGSLWAGEITAAEVVAVVEKIGARSQAVARRSFEILSVIFGHGVAKCLAASNPCASLKVSAIVGAPKPKRERLKLTREELRSVLLGLPALGRANELSVRILLATCVRKGELLGARAGSTWTWSVRCGRCRTKRPRPDTASSFRSRRR